MHPTFIHPSRYWFTNSPSICSSLLWCYFQRRRELWVSSICFFPSPSLYVRLYLPSPHQAFHPGGSQASPTSLHPTFASRLCSPLIRMKTCQQGPHPNLWSSSGDPSRSHHPSRDEVSQGYHCIHCRLPLLLSLQLDSIATVLRKRLHPWCFLSFCLNKIYSWLLRPYLFNSSRIWPLSSFSHLPSGPDLSSSKLYPQPLTGLIASTLLPSNILNPPAGALTKAHPTLPPPH